jgi:LacI family transcriptional regulator
MRITIEQIAKEMGVSISTVSNALNNKGKISTEKRKKIIAHAKQVGYPFEEKIMRKKSGKKIGVIFPHHSTANEPNYYISEVLVGVEERIRSTGISIMIESHQNLDMLPELLKQNLDGLLLIGGQFPEEFIVKLATLEYPVFTIGTYTMKAPLHAVVADNHLGAYQATTHLLELGHRDIALLNGPETTSSSRKKYEGYREALLSFGVTPDKNWIMSCDFTVDCGYQAMMNLLRSDHRPTAVFAGDDPIGIGAIRAIQEFGLSVPNDIAVVGFGNSSMGMYVSPALTSVNVYQRKLGYHGAGRLLELIEQSLVGRRSKSYRIVYSTKLEVRESCGASLAVGNVNA